MSDSERPVRLPDHLWSALTEMSAEMGVPEDALVSQGVFMLARLNGYLVAGKAAAPGAAPALPTAASPALAPAPKPPPAAAPSAKSSANKQPLPSAPVKKAKPAPIPEPEPEEPEEEEPHDAGGDLDEEGNPFDDPPPEDEPPHEEEPPPEDDPPPEEEEPPPPPPAKKGGGPTLTLLMAGREPLKVSGDQVLIGRGKHCDYVIESNRVSREHARIGREGDGFVLEDLNSSNGTFFGPNKDKVTRRKLKDGDEITFGTEKVKFRIGAR